MLEFEDLYFPRFRRGGEFDVGFGEVEEHGSRFVLFFLEKGGVFRRREEVLDGRVAEQGGGVSGDEEDEAEREEVGGDEEEA